jgi:hypothetical protein
MATLKQILIAVAAAAVGVLASPLAADATAPTSLGAPKPTATEFSKPLEGKALEDYLANGPPVPEGSIDISNTTLAAELTGFYEAHHDGGTGLTKRSGCSQGNCPDFGNAFDLLEQHIVATVWDGVVNYWAYWGRWNDCGQCGKIQTSAGGCFDFTSCGRPQQICIDSANGRAHRIWKDNGAKGCYSIAAHYFTDACPPIFATNIKRPTGEVACTW